MALISSVGFLKEGAITSSYNQINGDVWVAKYTNGAPVTLFSDLYTENITDFQFQYVKSAPTYSLTANANSVIAGKNATFTLSTTGLQTGASINYTISGVNSSDISSSLLNNSVVIDSNGQATLSIPTLASTTNQGNKTNKAKNARRI